MFIKTLSKEFMWHDNAPSMFDSVFFSLSLIEGAYQSVEVFGAGGFPKFTLP